MCRSGGIHDCRMKLKGLMKKAAQKLCVAPLATFTPRVCVWVILTLAILALCNAANAASRTWDGGSLANNNWTTAANWLTDVAPVANDDLLFGGVLRLTPNNDFAANTQFNDITFNLVAGAFTLGGNTITLGGNVTDNNITAVQTINLNMILNGNRQISVVAGGTLSISGAISETGGSQNLTINGAGNLNLSGNNTYSGDTAISGGGTVTVSGGNGIGDSSKVTLQNSTGTRLNLANNETIGSLQGGGANGGNVTLNANTLTVGGNNLNTAYAGVISGTGGLTKVGTGEFRLDSANTYSGGTTLSGGTIRLGADNVIPDTGTFAFSGGGLDTRNHTETIGALSLTANSAIILQTGARHDLTFASASRTGGTLTIDNWKGTVGVGASANEDRIIFNSNANTGGFLANVFWNDQNITGAEFISLGGNQWELVPVPEPGTIFAGCLLVGIFGWTERKRLRRLFRREARS